LAYFDVDLVEGSGLHLFGGVDFGQISGFYHDCSPDDWTVLL
jgi:hypothetical protein